MGLYYGVTVAATTTSTSTITIKYLSTLIGPFSGM
jgi:hypothetical protein